MKKVSVAKRSAASRKAWRTRKLMKLARESVQGSMQVKQQLDYEILQAQFLAEADGATKNMLPCPNFGDKR